MRRPARGYLLSCVGLLAALAAPPAAHGANTVALVQPDEWRAWACEFPATVTSVVSSAATHLRGDPAGQSGSACTGLLTSVQVNTLNDKQVIWRFTPASLDATREHVCWVHILVDDADGDRLACDGAVNVRKRKPPP